jgi:hypothetical protein
MYCRKCGTAHADEAEKCIYCGEVFRTAVEKPAEAPVVPTYLGQAIVSTLCCCLPLGIASWVFSAQVSRRLRAGDYPGARRASENANLFSWLSLGIGFTLALLWLLLRAAGVDLTR